MVDAAYWHLAKRYNEAAAYDPKAKAKLEELNEAYIVLGSAEKREEYMKIRAEVLGEGALPQAPRLAASPPPLAMMSRQRPQERATPKVESERRHLLPARTAVGAFVLAGFAGVALAATVSLVIAVAVGAALVAILAVVVAVAGLPQLRAAGLIRLPRSMGFSSLKARAPGQRPHAQGDPLDSIRLQAEQLRRLAARPEESEADDEPARGVDADRLDDLGLQTEQQRRIAVDMGVSQSQATPTDRVHADEVDESELLDLLSHRTEKQDVSHHDAAPERVSGDPLDKIKRQAEQFRRVAAAQSEATANASQDARTTEPVDPEQLDKIKQQTDRLRNIAAKFNASKGEAKPDSKPKN